MVERLQKAEGKNKRLIKDINDMRAVINTSAPSLGEERSKTIRYLKRQMVLMEEESIKQFKEEKNIFKMIPKKHSKTVKIGRLCFK